MDTLAIVLIISFHVLILIGFIWTLFRKNPEKPYFPVYRENCHPGTTRHAFVLFRIEKLKLMRSFDKSIIIPIMDFIANKINDFKKLING